MNRIFFAAIAISIILGMGCKKVSWEPEECQNWVMEPKIKENVEIKEDEGWTGRELGSWAERAAKLWERETGEQVGKCISRINWVIVKDVNKIINSDDVLGGYTKLTNYLVRDTKVKIWIRADKFKNRDRRIIGHELVHAVLGCSSDFGKGILRVRPDGNHKSGHWTRNGGEDSFQAKLDRMPPMCLNAK